MDSSDCDQPQSVLAPALALSECMCIFECLAQMGLYNLCSLSGHHDSVGQSDPLGSVRVQEIDLGCGQRILFLHLLDRGQEFLYSHSRPFLLQTHGMEVCGRLCRVRGEKDNSRQTELPDKLKYSN